MNTILFACLVVVLFSCNNLNNSDNVKSFIPGTYCSEWETEFSKTKDTLLLQQLTQNGSETYQITRRSQVIFINTAKNRPFEYRLIKWAGTYDSKTKTIFINNNGRVLSFDPMKATMWMGTIRYQKL